MRSVLFPLDRRLLRLSVVGFVFFAWSMFGLALIRVDLAISSGGAYVPSGSLYFESSTFIVLLITSVIVSWWVSRP